jgi:hypothetical protein
MLAISTSLDIISYVFAHLWPPVVLFHELDSFADPWVTMHWWIVMSFDKFSFSVYVSGDDDSFAFIPCPIDAFKLMWVNPWFEAFFILMMLVSDGCDCLGKYMFG